MYDSKHRTTDGQIYETRKDGSGYSSTKREWNLQTHGFNDETSNHRKYMRTQSSTNNRIVPNQQRQNGDKKAIKDTKKPLRVSGDWSEFKSSTGKTYFYNCKTEISQWEKPKGWTTSDDTSSNRTSTTSTSSTDRIKKESTTNVSSTVRSRYKMEESFSQKKNSQILEKYQNGNHHTFQESLQSNEQLAITSNNRLPSPGDDSSRMSFSSTSSKESSLVVANSSNVNESNGIGLHSSLSEPAVSVSTPVSDVPANIMPTNGNDMKNSVTRSIIPNLTSTESTSSTVIEPVTPSISKAERDQEIHRYYRAELIQHLTDWPSTQLEKQCLKLFDDYYGYSAKMSTAFTELKALKSNFRVLEIKRNILTQKLLRYQKHAKDKLL